MPEVHLCDFDQRPPFLPHMTLSEASIVVDMGNNKLLTTEVIAQIIALKESGLQTKQILEQIGASHRSVRRWVAKFSRNGGVELPKHEKPPGRVFKTSPHAMNIVKRS